MTSCEGTKVRLNCPKARVLNIHVATSGRLDPDLEICNQNQPLFCSKDITRKLQNNCERRRQCTISVSTYDFTEQCEGNEYLAFDVQYLCGNYLILSTLILYFLFSQFEKCIFALSILSAQPSTTFRFPCYNFLR